MVQSRARRVGLTLGNEMRRVVWGRRLPALVLAATSNRRDIVPSTCRMLRRDFSNASVICCCEIARDDLDGSSDASVLSHRSCCGFPGLVPRYNAGGGTRLLKFKREMTS